MGPRTDRSLTGLSGKLRRQTGALLVDNFFRGISRAGKLHPHAQPHRHDVEVLEDVPYRDTGLGEHRLDVYRPAGIRRGELSQAPVVLYVHGGGFRILSKETHWIMGLAYARRGYLVFNISYRLAPRHPFPAAVEDAGAALAWVRDNAARYGGDPERLVLAGESAGANLVTSLSLVTSYRRSEPWARELFDSGISPRAVVAACGILQVSGVERFKRRWPHMKSFIEDRLHEVSDSYLGDLSRVPEETRELADPLLLRRRPRATLATARGALERTGRSLDHLLPPLLELLAVQAIAPQVRAHFLVRQRRGLEHDLHLLLGRPVLRSLGRGRSVAGLGAPGPALAHGEYGTRLPKPPR